MADTSTYKFTPTHEWVKIDGDMATVGITKHAEEELGDVALVQFPEVGRFLQQGEKFGEVESIKAVSDLFAPISGEVVEVNSSLESAPETVNADPYDAGWMVKLRMSEPAQAESLMTESDYNASIS